MREGRSPTEGTLDFVARRDERRHGVAKILLERLRVREPVHMPTERSLVKWSPPME